MRELTVRTFLELRDAVKDYRPQERFIVQVVARRKIECIVLESDRQGMHTVARRWPQKDWGISTIHDLAAEIAEERYGGQLFHDATLVIKCQPKTKRRESLPGHQQPALSGDVWAIVPSREG